MAFLLSFNVMVGALISVAAALGGNSRFCVITSSSRSRPPSYVVSSRIVSESNKYMSSPRMVRMASINSLTLLRGANNSFFNPQASLVQLRVHLRLSLEHERLVPAINVVLGPERVDADALSWTGDELLLDSKCCVQSAFERQPVVLVHCHASQ